MYILDTQFWIWGQIKSSVQQKLRWVWIGVNRLPMAWGCGAGHYFDFLLCRHLTLNIFPFPVTTAKLIGEFYNNRRSAAHGCPHFAYSYVFLMLHQYCWRCDPFSANRQSTANEKKIRENFLLALRIRLLAQRRRLASPLSARSDVALITHSI